MKATARERYRAAGLCVRCGAARHGASLHCRPCLVRRRLETRRRHGWAAWRPGKAGRPPLDRPRGDDKGSEVAA